MTLLQSIGGVTSSGNPGAVMQLRDNLALSGLLNFARSVCARRDMPLRVTAAGRDIPR